MSQTTRCPSCQTRFKVVADQLRISDGWVRCGQCNQVFDATDSLEAAPPPAMLSETRLDKLRETGAQVATPLPAQPRALGAELARAESAGAGAATTLVDLSTFGSSGTADNPTEHEAHALEFESGSQTDFENTVPAALWPDFESDEPLLGPGAPGSAVDPPSGAERWRPFRRTADARQENRSPLVAPAELKLPAQADAVASSARGALTPPGSSGESSHPDPASLFHSSLPGGYELPSSDEDDQTENALLFSDLPDTQDQELADKPPIIPQDMSIAVRRVEPAGPAEPAEPDLAHFIAELAEWQDSRRPEAHTAKDAPRTRTSDGTQRHEPFLDAAGVIPREASDALPSTTELPDAASPLLVSKPYTAFASSAGIALASPEQPENHLNGVDAEPVNSDWDDESEPPEAMEPTFVRHARRRAIWTSWRVRAGLGLAALLLVGLLLGQALVHHRDVLAASFPNIRSALVRLCEPLQCVIRPHRDIGAILVDGSSFNRTKGDRYQFLLTLRNRSALQVQAPVIELSLTDVQDQPVVRRVLTAQELNLPKMFQPQQEWSGEIPMLMAPGTTRIAGYRVLAFYND